jgi:hypothetical protein
MRSERGGRAAEGETEMARITFANGETYVIKNGALIRTQDERKAAQPVGGAGGRKNAQPLRAEGSKTPENSLSDRIRKGLSGLSDWYRGNFCEEAPRGPARWSRDVENMPSLAQYDVSNRLAELGIWLSERANTEYMKCRVYGDMSSYEAMERDRALIDELRLEALRSGSLEGFLDLRRDDLAYLYEKYSVII